MSGWASWSWRRKNSQNTTHWTNNAGTYPNTYIHTYIFIRYSIQLYIISYTHTYIYTRIHTNTLHKYMIYIHNQINMGTYIHTYIHSNIHIGLWSSHSMIRNFLKAASSYNRLKYTYIK